MTFVYRAGDTKGGRGTMPTPLFCVAKRKKGDRTWKCKTVPGDCNMFCFKYLCIKGYMNEKNSVYKKQLC